MLNFGADMGTSIHIDNKKRHISTWKGPTQGLESSLTAQKCTQLTLQKRNFV